MEITQDTYREIERIMDEAAHSPSSNPQLLEDTETVRSATVPNDDGSAEINWSRDVHQAFLRLLLAKGGKGEIAAFVRNARRFGDTFSSQAPPSEPPTLPPSSGSGDGGRPEDDWLPKPGDTVFHVVHGKVIVEEICRHAEYNATIIRYRHPKGSIAETFAPETFAPFDPESVHFKKLMSTHLGQFKYLPQIVGIAYIEIFSDHFKRFLSTKHSFRPEVLLWNARINTASIGSRFSSLRPGGSDRTHFQNREFAPLDHVNKLFEDIWNETGIDVVEQGFRYVGGNPRILEGMLRSQRKGVYSHVSARDYNAAFRRRFIVSDAALQYYRERVGNLKDLLGIEKETLPRFVWSVGDYDSDHSAYIALRDSDPQAVAMFADRMASVIGSEPAFAEASIVVAVPGRESHGMPVNILAREVAQRTGKTFLDGIWQDRSETRRESETRITFREKLDQAFRNYNLIVARGRSQRELIGQLAGQTVILIDDNYTTGATMTAASLALLNAGAKRVLRLVATQTNRQNHVQSDDSPSRSGTDAGRRRMSRSRTHRETHLARTSRRIGRLSAIGRSRVGAARAPRI